MPRCNFYVRRAIGERSRPWNRKWRLLLFLGVGILLISGCDSVSRHKVLSTVFDGVPTLPEPVALCDEYYLQRRAAEEAGRQVGADGLAAEVSQRSSHKPYAEKKCSDCHTSDKSVSDGLLLPKRELCLHCHVNFVTGSNVHGPVAVGDCLACHLPHSSGYPSLLKESPDKICASCHQEQRLALAMHERFVNKGIGCGECHDPHSGNARYFLK